MPKPQNIKDVIDYLLLDYDENNRQLLCEAFFSPTPCGEALDQGLVFKARSVNFKSKAKTKLLPILYGN